MLDAVGDAVGEARWSEALARAVDLWRSAREPALGDLVEALGQLGGDEMTKAARALGAPSAFDASGHPDNPARWPGLHAQLAALDAAPHDPRTGLALARLVGRPPPWLDPRGWLAVCDEAMGERLAAHADRRAIAVLAPATTDAARRPRVMKWIDGIERAVVRYPRWSLADRQRVAAWVDTARRARESSRAVLAELLAAVHAAPDDLAAREVYADALLEHGDPRGELMVLSLGEERGRVLTDDDRRQMAYLLAEHEAEWLGRDVMRATRDRVWRNGMLEEVRLVSDVPLPPTVRIVRR